MSELNKEYDKNNGGSVDSAGSPISNNKNGVENTTSNPVKKSTNQDKIKPGIYSIDYAPSDSDIRDTSSRVQSDSTRGRRDFLTGLENTDIRDHNEINAQAQSAWAHLGKGVARTAVKFVGEVAKLPGYAVGGAMALGAEEGQGMDTFVNNAWIRAIDDASEDINDDLLRVYQTRASTEGSLMDAIMSSSFWATDGADGLGFILSMLVPGAAFKAVGVGGKVMSGMSTMTKALSNSQKAMKIAANINKVSKISGSAIDMTLMTAANTLFESGAEAGGAMRAFEEQFSEFYGKYSKEDMAKLNADLSAGVITQSEYEQLKSDVYDKVSAKFQEQKGNLGADIFKSNLVILTGPNLIQNMLLFGGGGRITSSLLKSRQAVGKTLAKGAAGGVVAEGFIEEGFQTTVENYYTNKAKKNELIGSLLKDSNISGLVEEYGETLTSLEGQKAIFLGAFFGGIMGGVGNVRTSRDNFEKSKNILNALDEVKRLNELVTNRFKVDDDGKLIIDPKTGKPEVNTANLAEIANSLGSNVALTEMFKELVDGSNTNTNDVLSNEESVELIRSYAAAQMAATLAKDPDLSMEAVADYFKTTLESIHKDDNISQQEKTLLEQNLKKVEKIVNNVTSDFRSYAQIYEDVGAVNSIDTSSLEGKNKKQQLDGFISYMLNKFLNSKGKIKTYEDTLTSVKEKKEQLLKLNPNALDTESINRLDLKIKTLEKLIEEETKVLTDVHLTKEGAQKEFDEYNGAIKAFARAERMTKELTSLKNAVNNAKTIKALDSLKNKYPEHEAYFTVLVENRRKEIEDEEELKTGKSTTNNTQISEEDGDEYISEDNFSQTEQDEILLAMEELITREDNPIELSSDEMLELYHEFKREIANGNIVPTLGFSDYLSMFDGTEEDVKDHVESLRQARIARVNAKNTNATQNTSNNPVVENFTGGNTPEGAKTIISEANNESTVDEIYEGPLKDMIFNRDGERFIVLNVDGDFMDIQSLDDFKIYTVHAEHIKESENVMIGITFAEGYSNNDKIVAYEDKIINLNTNTVYPANTEEYNKILASFKNHNDYGYTEDSEQTLKDVKARTLLENRLNYVNDTLDDLYDKLDDTTDETSREELKEKLKKAKENEADIISKIKKLQENINNDRAEKAAEIQKEKIKAEEEAKAANTTTEQTPVTPQPEPAEKPSLNGAEVGTPPVNTDNKNITPVDTEEQTLGLVTSEDVLNIPDPEDIEDLFTDPDLDFDQPSNDERKANMTDEEKEASKKRAEQHKKDNPDKNKAMVVMVRDSNPRFYDWVTNPRKKDGESFPVKYSGKESHNADYSESAKAAEIYQQLVKPVIQSGGKFDISSGAMLHKAETERSRVMNKFENNYKGKKGTIEYNKARRDALRGINERIESILKNAKGNLISPQDVLTLIKHLPLQMVVDNSTEGSKIYGELEHLKNETVENDRYNTTKHGSLPIRIQLIDALLNGKMDEVEVVIHSQLSGDIMINKDSNGNNIHSSLDQLLYLSNLSEEERIAELSNNLYYSNGVDVRNGHGQVATNILPTPGKNNGSGKGSIYLRMPRANGQYSFIKLNQGTYEWIDENTPGQELTSAITLMGVISEQGHDIFTTTVTSFFNGMDTEYSEAIAEGIQDYIDEARRIYGKDTATLKDLLNLFIHNSDNDRTALLFQDGYIKVGSLMTEFASPEVKAAIGAEHVIKATDLTEDTDLAREMYVTFARYLTMLRKNTKVKTQDDQSLLKDKDYIRFLLRNRHITTNAVVDQHVFGNEPSKVVNDKVQYKSHANILLDDQLRNKDGSFYKLSFDPTYSIYTDLPKGSLRGVTYDSVDDLNKKKRKEVKQTVKPVEAKPIEVKPEVVKPAEKKVSTTEVTKPVVNNVNEVVTPVVNEVVNSGPITLADAELTSTEEASTAPLTKDILIDTFNEDGGVHDVKQVIKTIEDIEASNAKDLAIYDSVDDFAKFEMVTTMVTEYDTSVDHWAAMDDQAELRRIFVELQAKKTANITESLGKECS